MLNLFQHANGRSVDFSIRLAAASDIAAMHRIRLAVRENRLADGSAIGEDAYVPFVAAGSAWVAEANNGIVGFAALDFGRGRVWALFVAPGSEGAGIGRALHDRLVAQASRPLWLTTSPGTRAETFYERAGWRRAGVTSQGELRFELAPATASAPRSRPRARS